MFSGIGKNQNAWCMGLKSHTKMLFLDRRRKFEIYYLIMMKSSRRVAAAVHHSKMCNMSLKNMGILTEFCASGYDTPQNIFFSR